MGSIRSIHPNHVDMDVEFESDHAVMTFTNVLDPSHCLLVGDNCPTSSTLTVGRIVAVRVNQDKNVFYEGIIVEKRASPVAFRVKLSRPFSSSAEGVPEEVNASRVNIRLLQPPWFDDLEDLGLTGSVTPDPQCFSPMTPTTPGGSSSSHPGPGFRLERPVSSSAGSLERDDCSEDDDDEMLNDSISFDSSGVSTPR